MFGFQRTGDAFWAAADQMTRGFIIGATAGRTTLTGEGLQHADGHSPLLASTNPAVVTYDPAYGYEMGHIIRDGIERMYGPDSTDRNLMYYLTVYNEPISQPAEPDDRYSSLTEYTRSMCRRTSSAKASPDPSEAYRLSNSASRIWRQVYTCRRKRTWQFLPLPLATVDLIRGSAQYASGRGPG